MLRGSRRMGRGTPPAPDRPRPQGEGPGPVDSGRDVAVLLGSDLSGRPIPGAAGFRPRTSGGRGWRHRHTPPGCDVEAGVLNAPPWSEPRHAVGPGHDGASYHPLRTEAGAAGRQTFWPVEKTLRPT